MDLELRHLRAFVVVAEERHFGRAAQRLHVTQPSLSQQIRRIEQELGTELLDRKSLPIRVTAAGAAFLEEARYSLLHARWAVERGRQAALGRVGQLSLGATYWAHCAIVPAAIKAFRDRAPNVSLHLSTAPPTEHLEAVRKEQLDVAFAAFPQWLIGGPALHVEPVLDEPMVVIVADHHPLARRSEISLHELGNERLVALSHPMVPGLVDKQMETLQEHGFAPAEIQEVPDPPALLSFVAAGVGVGIHMASLSNLRPRGVAFVPIAGDAPTAKLLLISRRDDDRPLVKLFLQTIREAARSRAPPEVFRDRIGASGQPGE